MKHACQSLYFDLFKWLMMVKHFKIFDQHLKAADKEKVVTVNTGMETRFLLFLSNKPKITCFPRRL